MASTLIYGYGNPGRQDDGLGPALVEALESLAVAAGLRGVDFESNYQLNAEDALPLSEHDRVIFVDATREGDGPYTFRALEPAAAIRFSTHAMSPESVLALCGELYGRRPVAHLLALRGYAWEPNAAMTPAARGSLEAGLAFLGGTLLGTAAKSRGH
jgi:hydrogenase maturation protease